jgi:type I restriction enzyme M protein
MREQINQREVEEVERLEVEYKEHSDRLARTIAEIAELRAQEAGEGTKTEKAKIEARIGKLDTQKAKVSAKIAERDERIAETRRRTEEDRRALTDVGNDLGALYGDPDELLKHARVVPLAEISENEFDLNIPRYVDTFDPEPALDVKGALKALIAAEAEAHAADSALRALLKESGYAT